MGAFSFKRRFVTPIRLGLSVGYERGGVFPKRQTIRAHRKDGRLCKPDEPLALYCGMRTPSCFLIGRAVCVEAQPIEIHFRRRARSDWIRCGRHGKLDDPESLRRFAREDGFFDWWALREFWREEHPGVDDFEGTITFWRAP